MREQDTTIRLIPPHPSKCGSVCQVGPGGCPPRPPTDPDVRDYRIRLFEVRLRYGRQTE